MPTYLAEFRPKIYRRHGVPDGGGMNVEFYRWKPLAKPIPLLNKILLHRKGILLDTARREEENICTYFNFLSLSLSLSREGPKQLPISFFGVCTSARSYRSNQAWAIVAMPGIWESGSPGKPRVAAKLRCYLSQNSLQTRNKPMKPFGRSSH